MNCYRCQRLIADDSRFCPTCGAVVPDVTLPTPAADELDDDGARELELLIRADTAGEYEILREIGRGGMGVVYLAREIALARDVAMKVLPPDLTYGKGVIGRFRREARTAAALEHPNIVPVYRIAPGGRVFWYTMKYLEGRSLAEVLQERKVLPVAATITILERIADALDYAHHRHVIHRDVKPANVMLEQRGHIVVMDFGIAKEAAAGTMARSESIIGTPYYMSPEQCRGETLTGASDQYSVGVMAYQMLSGRVPFDSKTVVDLLQKHCSEPPPPLAVLQPALPKHVIDAVERAMAKDPTERFPSVITFIRALIGPTTDSTVRLPRGWSLRQRFSFGSGQQPASSRPRRDWGVLGGRFLTVAAFALAVGALWRSRDPNAAGPAAHATDSAVGRMASPSTPSSLPSAGASSPRTTAAGSAVPVPVPAPRTVLPAFPRATRLDADRATPRSALLVVQTIGGWARIYVDGALRREGTAYRDTVTAGEHRVRLEREGYGSLDTTLFIRSRDTVLVRLNLRRTGS